jgi:hypothetical protein
MAGRWTWGQFTMMLPANQLWPLLRRTIADGTITKEPMAPIADRPLKA